MKKLTAMCVALILSLSALTACGSQGQESSSNTDESVNTTESEISTESKSESETTVTTSVSVPDAAHASSTPVMSIPDEQSATVTDSTNAESEEKDRSMETLRKMFSFMTDDGRARDTAIQTEAAIDATNYYEIKDLSKDNIANYTDDKTMFRFIMSNQSTVAEKDGIYYTELHTDEQDYLVVFGTSEYTTLEEASMYAKANTKALYYAFASESNGTPILLPVIAGSDKNGYFFVRSVIKTMGFDISSLGSLPENIEIGISLDETTANTSDSTSATESESQ